jgi:hypothetical protein
MKIWLLSLSSVDDYWAGYFFSKTSFFKKICSVYFAFDGRLYLRLLMFRLNDRCALGFDMPPPPNLEEESA